MTNYIMAHYDWFSDLVLMLIIMIGVIRLIMLVAPGIVLTIAFFASGKDRKKKKKKAKKSS